PPMTSELPVPVAAGESAAPKSATVQRGRSLLPPLPIPATRTGSRTAAFTWGATSAAALLALCAVLLVVACATRRWPRGRVDGTEVYLSRRFGPALVGILSPRPVIPSWVLESEPDARAAILRHEQEHARARDHLALLYAGIVVAALPWSPAIWWMCRRLRAAIEMDCDQRVIAGGIGAADYGAILLHAGARSHSRWGLAPAMGQPKSLLERRLKTMNEKRKLNPVHGLLLAGAAATALAIACDTRSPTQLNDAIDEVITEGREGEATPLATGEAARRPLIFVDGERVASDELWPDDGSLSPLLHALDIKRIEILTGVSATDIHGEDAANGVIKIFTEETPRVKLPFTVDRVDMADIPVPSVKRSSGDDSSFGFEVDLPVPAEWNGDLSFQVGMPVANIGNRIRMLETAITDGFGDAEMSFEGDGSFRGWFKFSGDTRYGEVERFLESLAAAAR
ncbi:MAG: TonB-dependent receptor plug domain-containing protein, partial [Gemmatimonadetes bacterium]|nr:TonB-dependent receptor plug domain-containing protein [Gemmatimonadota bacterium]